MKCYMCGASDQEKEFHSSLCVDCSAERQRERYANAEPADPNGEYKCQHCHEVKKGDEFVLKGINGRQSYCKACRAAIERTRYPRHASEKRAKVNAYYHENKERIAARRKELHLANPEVRKAIQQRHNEKRRAKRAAEKADQNETKTEEISK